ncbi:hypothetical protein Salat_2384700 [Sesamum alatum]|uniref:RIN4 pathogenic type III effector avirulence factor Avr cleavage site domain-containing protein n=1 Tax=Sesamum alatum TaxID=300844 RepID=A0AAE2CF10_9LAMI|nr:hypothetical protein Salat_2384700 [Sesamum alatum]
MDEFYWRKSHVPAFGSWDCNDDLPFTQCFESARQAGLLRYNYSQDRDLYVAGDLYENHVVTPAMIVVPRRRGKTAAGYPKEKQGKRDGWMMCDCDCELRSQVSPVAAASPTPTRAAPKAVDEDLYKISPHLLRQHAKRKRRAWGGIFSSCLRPTCVC